jgi:hypothetical protein
MFNVKIAPVSKCILLGVTLTAQYWILLEDPVNDHWHVPGYSTGEFRHASAVIEVPKIVIDISLAFALFSRLRSLCGPCAVLVRSLCGVVRCCAV